ncbi:MAG TPA: CaiB/BaiF CoA-transferase family protein [Hyphomicrobiales bacterium]|nr:CaiB/BaiF CoA-transferase family protein [Hyphomicrobiales bacterium]
MRPLEGITVIDFTTLLPGPLATLMLAEAGARVIKVERPGGEDMRFYPPAVGGVSAHFAALNRGKEGFVLDLEDAGSRAALMELAARADVIVEQFRPGVIDRLGFGYEAVKVVNPGIVFCSISGYGQTGPKAMKAGHDLNYQAETGILALSHGPTEAPVLPATLTADIGGGSMPAVINILLALLKRNASGEGTRIDIAMTDAMFAFAPFPMSEGNATGHFPKNGQGYLTGALPRYGLYPTADGRIAAIAALEPKFWQRFCELIQLPAELRNDIADPPATRAAVSAAIRARTAEEWIPLFAEADCCANIARTLEEAMADPDFIERGLFARKVLLPNGDTMPAAAVPIVPELREDDGEAKPFPAI